MTYRLPWYALLALAIAAASSPGVHADPLVTNRDWDRLPAPAQGNGRRTLAAAAEATAATDLRLAGETLDAQRLKALAATSGKESLTRRLREALGQAVDRLDFLYFLDDVARDQPSRVRVHSGRARRAGILLHPEDVFGSTQRTYGGSPLAIEPPPQPPELEPAADGAPLGPRWSARYPNPADEAARMAALTQAGRDAFRNRLEQLFNQIREQGGEVFVLSTLRRRERGYLMYGAFILSRADEPATVDQRVGELNRLNREWDLDIPIRWRHPGEWRATVGAASAMAEAYNVVYATRSGARHSSHYRGTAIDVAATRLPRRLELKAPDGSRRVFDLSAAREPRDLNLTPRLIGWLETHFGLRKLRSDYPHWEDAAAR